MITGTERFFAFINERELIRLRKEADLLDPEHRQGPPWTQDPILREYKFTNVRRHHDRTSRELRQRFYGPHFYDAPEDILMNCALFRYFGTWEFADAVGWQTHEEFDFEGIKDLAGERLLSGERVFTGAYVITNQGISAPKQEVVVDIFLKGLHERAKALIGIVHHYKSWERVAKEMSSLMGFGGTGFMTKEVLLDTTYTSFWGDVEENKDGSFSFPKDWWVWTPVGPGGLRGAARVIGDTEAKPVSKAQADMVIDHLFKEQWRYWTHGRLAPTDIQFQLCEFDKYERVRLGQGKPRSRYKP